MGQPLRSVPRRSGTRFLFIGVLMMASASAAMAQPIAAPSSAVAQAISNAKSFVYDIDDAPCTFVTRMQVQSEASAIGTGLQRMLDDARREGRTSDASALASAVRSFGLAIDDYLEDCGPSVTSGYFYIPGTDTAIRVTGYVRVENHFVGDKIGVGVLPIPGDPFFAKQSDSIRGTGLGSSLNYSSGQWQYSIGMRYSWGDQGKSAQSQNGTVVGYAPGDAGAGPGFSDNNAFTAGSKAKYSDFSLNYNAMRQFNLEDGFNWGWKPELTPGAQRESEKYFGMTATLDVNRFRHDGHMYWTDFPNQLDIRIDQSLDTYAFTAGPKIAGRRNLGSGFYVFAMGDVQAGFMYSKLNSREDILCPGACLPPVIDINESKTDFAWRANAEIGAGYMVNRNFDVKVTAGAQYGNRHIVDLRRNPPDRSTHIGTETGWDWLVALKGHVKF